MSDLIGISIYDGETVIRRTLCEIHFTAYMEAGEFPAQMDDQMKLDEECSACENEQDSPIRICSVCGGEIPEHNWETHVMELRADG